MFVALWRDDRGFVVSIELIMIATIAIIGVMAGLTAVRDAVVSEISDVAGGVQDFNQSWWMHGVLGSSGTTSGGRFIDRRDYCDSSDDIDGNPDNCITIFNRNRIDEGAPLSTP